MAPWSTSEKFGHTDFGMNNAVRREPAQNNPRRSICQTTRAQVPRRLVIQLPRKLKSVRIAGTPDALEDDVSN